MSIEYRNIPTFEIRETKEGDGMTVEARVVPFDTPTNIGWYTETFDHDCVFDGLENVKMTVDHDHVIGTWSDFDQREDGMYATGHISNTSEGRDIAQLVRDKAIDACSVGFVPVERSVDQSDIVHRRRVTLKEVALTGLPAYPDAKINSQRNITNQPETKEDKEVDEELMKFMQETRNSILEMKGKIDKEPAAPIGSQYRNAGEYLKALATGDEQAAQFMKQARDFINSSDVTNQPAWVTDQIRLVESRRTVMNLVTRAALPASGMSVEYYVLGNDTMKAAQQTDEGSALQYGEISLGTATANVNTYGGYTQLSRQVIERATAPALTTALRALAIAYAVNTETAVRTYIGTAIAGASANKVTTAAAPSAMTADQWIDAIIDAATAVDSRGAMLGTLAVSPDVFKAIAKITRQGSALMDVSGRGPDNLGTIDLTDIRGTMMRIPVQMLPTAATDTAAFIDPDSITVWESGGPFQLQDQDIINLTGTYSIYGYMAMGTTFSGGITPLATA